MKLHQNTILAYTANGSSITAEVLKRYCSVSAQTYFEYLVEKSAELCTNTVRMYKRSVCIKLEHDGKEAEANQLLGLFDAIDNPARGRKLKLVRRVPHKIFERTLSILRASKSKTSHHAADLLVATAITGLRPSEWENASLDGRTLTVQNAKHSDLRGNGEERELELLDTITVEERAAIENTICLIRAKTYKSVRPNLAVAFKSALADAIKQLEESRWFMRLRLYDFRHQFSADAKLEWGIGTGMVAAAMGHSVEDTAVQHYGRRKYGSGGMKVRPSDASIAKVRRLYPVQDAPPAAPSPATGRIKLSF